MKIRIEAGRKYFVHRYRWSHDDKRRAFKRFLKEGLVKILHEEKDGWLYQAEKAK
jgi:hypothetical protein